MSLTVGPQNFLDSKRMGVLCAMLIREKDWRLFGELLGGVKDDRWFLVEGY